MKKAQQPILVNKRQAQEQRYEEVGRMLGGMINRPERFS
jgi:hypothetical protein